MYRVDVPLNKWHRGAAAAERAFLIDPVTGHADIIGTSLLFLGYERTTLFKYRFPSQFVQHVLGRRQFIADPFSWLTNAAQADTEEAIQLIAINDDPNITDDERKRLLSSIVQPHGIDFRFHESTPTIKLTDIKFDWEVPIEEPRPATSGFTLQDVIESDRRHRGMPIDYVCGVLSCTVCG